jgi:hypothetical protein
MKGSCLPVPYACPLGAILWALLIVEAPAGGWGGGDAGPDGDGEVRAGGDGGAPQRARRAEPGAEADARRAAEEADLEDAAEREERPAGDHL